jgi:hypothetical protein
MNIEQLFKDANQNKFSYVLMLPLGDDVLETHLTNWLQERVNLVKTSYKHQKELEAMFDCADYVICSVGALKCVLDTTKPVFVNIHSDDLDIVNKSNVFVFDPLRNEDKTKIDYKPFLDLATKCLQKDLDDKWIPYYEV